MSNFCVWSYAQGINRLGKAPPRPGSLRPPDPNRNRVLDIYSEGTEGDADYMRMVQDVGCPTSTCLSEPFSAHVLPSLHPCLLICLCFSCRLRTCSRARWAGSLAEEVGTLAASISRATCTRDSTRCWPDALGYWRACRSCTITWWLEVAPFSGCAAFDKGDLLYLRDEEEKRRFKEEELRDSERAQFLRMQASSGAGPGPGSDPSLGSKPAPTRAAQREKPARWAPRVFLPRVTLKGYFQGLHKHACCTVRLPPCCLYVRCLGGQHRATLVLSMVRAAPRRACWPAL